jgi:Skp family chaperone for outer membrane proteins
MTFVRFCLFSLFMLIFGATSVQAIDFGAKDKIPPAVVAVIDLQRILQESLAAKSVQKQLEVQRGKFQTEIEGEENNLRKAEQELGKSRDQLAADIYADREQQLRQKFLTVERHVQSRRKLLDQASTDAMNTVRSGLLDIVNKLATSRGVNLVLVKQQALWLDKPLDMTDEVLKQLDKQLPTVTVKIAREP